ncbi:MAG: HAMP domain-containing protein [Gammaproteobacteria bacterium]|nr:HAMP domain-containing protein [Gammaproteobacteria bacterium]
MRIRLFHKLFLAIALASFGSIVLFAASAHWVMQRSFVRYLNEAREARLESLAGNLATHYADSGGWDALRGDRRGWRRLLLDVERPPAPPPGPPPGEARAAPPHQAEAGRPPHRGRGPVAVYDADHRLVAGHLPYAADFQSSPVIVDGRTVGWVAMPPLARPTEARDRRFERRQGQVLLIGGVIAALLSIAVAALTARRLVAPIRAVGSAARELAEGNFETRLAPGGRDEIGQLTDDFNLLARALHENESSRRRWFADISHELRTPLAIMHGELEAVQDGIRPNDARLLDSLHGETERLQRLIDDLYQLARADIGALDFEFRPQPLAPIVNQALARFARRFEACGLTIEQAIGGNLHVLADRERLDQLLDNLLENCCRYVTAPGVVHVSVTGGNGKAVIGIEDSGPGVDDAELARLFEPLQRGEASRNRRSGGSGLGLAICQRIAHAHGGRLTAAHAARGGLALRLELPLQEAP